MEQVWGCMRSQFKKNQQEKQKPALQKK